MNKNKCHYRISDFKHRKEFLKKKGSRDKNINWQLNLR